MEKENISRLFDFIYYQQAAYPQQKAFGYRWNEQEKWWSTQEIIDDAERLAAGLISIGLQKGDRVGIVDYNNRPEWVIADLALQLAGLISVPLYATISNREYTYIFEDADIKAVFTGGGDLAEKIPATIFDGKNKVIPIYFEPGQEGLYYRDLIKEKNPAIKNIADAIQPEELVTIIYTSGTTGFPKGVMLSHDNIVFNVKTILPLIPISAGMRGLSFLPLCHIFERAVSFAYMYAGIQCFFSSPDKLGGDEGDIKRYKPHFFTTVPRLLEKVYEKIYNKGLTLPPLKRGLFFWALRQAQNHEFDQTYTGIQALKNRIADKLIFSKWREALGGHLVGIITGAAPCPEQIARVFSFAGIPVREGYGLTETAPAIAFSQFAEGKAKLGTVGVIIDGIEVRIDEEDAHYGPGEGEIIVRGPNVMMGYYRKEEENKRAFMEIEGQKWFCTGDVGRWITDTKGTRFLKITDRKKELLKTSGGKYVAPAPIEGKLKESFLVDQAMVVGDNQKYVAALIVPSSQGLEDWCNHKEIPWKGLDQMLTEPRVIDKYQRIIDEVNPLFGKVEQIKKFALLPHTWEPTREDGSESELTPTMKLKRRVIMDKFADKIDTLYT
jgi:long-chain acyl-CoA synthetase